ncbi:MAG: MATE family efflux transporter [Rhodobacteraceae bacterium]|nr:MATE family efflux transporter [Paracoccaceae bacterium]
MTIAAQPQPWTGHVTATLTLGLPLIGSHVAQMLVHLTDTIMVGWYGVDDLAAVVLATSIFFVFFIVGSGFAMAVMPMAASAAAEGDTRQVRRVTRMGLWISVLYCAAWMPVLWYFEALMLMIGQKPEIAALAQDYMRIAEWGMLPAMLIMVLKSYLSALERPSFVLWATLIGAVANIGFNYAFIFGNWGAPEMGVRGAALASILTQVLTFAVVAAFVALHPVTKPYRLFVRAWRADWPALGEVFRLGWPIGTTMLAEVGLFSTAAIMMGWIGTRELATHGIAIQIASMSFMIYLGLAQAGTIRTGRALGRRDMDGIRRAALTVVWLQLATAAVAIALFLAVPERLIWLFLDADNPDSAAIVAYGVGLLVVAAAFQVVDGLQAVVLAVLRGLKDTRVPMICAVVSYWVIGIPASWLLGFTLGFGGYGIWAGLVIGLALAAVTLIWRYLYLIGRMDLR